MHVLEAVANALEGRAVSTTDEAALSNEVRRLLTAAGLRFEPEYRLSDRDRVDFLVEYFCGVELKTTGSVASIIRQLDRYAQHPKIAHLVLVTTSRRIARGMPDSLRGKLMLSICMGGL